MKFTSYLTKILTALCVFLWACSESETVPNNACLPEPDISKITIKPDFIRIDREIILADTTDVANQIKKVLQKHKLYDSLYLERPLEAKTDVLLPVLISMAKEPHLDSLLWDYEKMIPIDKLQEELTLLFRRTKAYYPDFVVPKVYFSISGIGSFPLNRATDVFLSKNNEILVIGLDWFLGPTYKYPLPTIVPQYIARRYVWQNIPSFVAQLIANRYNEYNSQDQTALNEMLGYAKTYYFAQSVIPCLPDSVVLGYTTAQMQYIAENKEAIWKHYLDKQVFFMTASRLKRDYVDEGPFTLPISQECPGGIARWTGLQMLKKYIQKKNISLPEVMKITDAQKVLNESGYKGK